MARTGKFGRQPRAAQSLTNTLVAIAREFQNQQDQNLMSAWQKGGTFEGHKVTDAEVLKYWSDRMSGVSKDDPLYDTYKQSHDQLDYTIHESKMTAAYSQHKETDAQMVGFYLGWAKKVPKDSEFYRVLQRDAGQYMRNARTNGVAAAARAAEAKYQSQQADTQKSKEAAGAYMIDTLRRVAQSGYADGGISALISEPGSGSDLTDFDPSDPGQMLRLLKAITSGTGTKSRGPVVGNTNTIFHDDNGKAVTGADIVAQLQKLDPGYQPGTPIDVSYVTGLLQRQTEGLDARIALAQKTGHLTDATNLQKSKAYVATLNREAGSWPAQKSYTLLRQTFDSVANDPSASPAAVLKAWGEYRNGLMSLSESPGIAANDNLRSRLVAEANGEAGVPTLAESFTGLQNGAFDPASAKDSANTAAHMEFLQGQVEAVDAGQAVWTYGITGKDGVFVPQAGGDEIGAASPQQVQAGGANMQTITVADPAGGVPLTMQVTATPVFATATDPVTGKPIQRTDANPVAFAYDVVKGGKTTTVYGFQTKDQGFVFSQDPPWDERLHTTNSSQGGNHIELDLSPAMPKSVDLSKNADLGNGWSVTNALTPAGKPAAGGGVLVFNPLAAATSTSTRNATGQADPTSDFHSLTLADLMGDSEGHAILLNLDKNPQFQNQLNADVYTFAGYQQDAKTGQWVPGPQADPNALAQAQQQVNTLKSASDITSAGLGLLQSLWSKAVTGSPFPGGASPSTPDQSGTRLQQIDAQFGRLPSDQIKGTPFGALGDAFIPGTNQLKPMSPEDTGAFGIKTGMQITVPGYTPPTPVAAQGVVAGQTSTQTGSTAPGATTQQQSAGQTGSLAPYDPGRRAS